MPYKGDKGDKNAARPPEGRLVETRCLIKGPKSAIVPFPGPCSGPKSRTGPGALAGGSPLSRLQTGLSDSRSLSSRALYRCLVRGAASDGLIGELGVTEAEGCLLWPWVPRMTCLNNNEASLTWLVNRNALWVGKKLFSAQQDISPEYGRCGDL